MDEATFQGYVEFARLNFADYKRDLWKEPAKGRAYSYRILPPDGRGDFLSGLIEGSGETKLEWDSVSLIAQELLREGEPLPAELAEYVADVLEGKRPRPNKGPMATSRRDATIFLAVDHVAQRFHLNPTRRRKPVEREALPHCCAEGGSACDVVGAAFGVGYKVAERAWDQRSIYWSPS